MATTKKKRKATEPTAGSRLAKRDKHGNATYKNPLATLLALPAELRNSIYDMVLDEIPQRITLRYFHQPAITRVCTQLRKDVLPMVHVLLQTRDWDIALPLCNDKATAMSLGLSNDEAYWQMATLKW